MSIIQSRPAYKITGERIKTVLFCSDVRELFKIRKTSYKIWIKFWERERLHGHDYLTSFR